MQPPLQLVMWTPTPLLILCDTWWKFSELLEKHSSLDPADLDPTKHYKGLLATRKSCLLMGFYGESTQHG